MPPRKRKNVSDDEESPVELTDDEGSPLKKKSKRDAVAKSSGTDKKKPSSKSKSKKKIVESDEEEEPAAAPKAGSSGGAPGEPKVRTTGDGDSYISLGAKKRLTVRSFKGKTLIDIREYYEDKDGTEKPGKKGISLQPDQWEEIKRAMDVVDRLVYKM